VRGQWANARARTGLATSPIPQIANSDRKTKSKKKYELKRPNPGGQRSRRIIPILGTNRRKHEAESCSPQDKGGTSTRRKRKNGMNHASITNPRARYPSRTSGNESASTRRRGQDQKRQEREGKIKEDKAITGRGLSKEELNSSAGEQ